ncbi:MAG: aldehyde dehydrogenase [Rhizorhabdus sp.]
MQFTAPALADAKFKPQYPEALFIGGEWRAPATGERLRLISPISEEEIGSLPAAAPADIDAAGAAARAAFDHGPWPRMSVAERAEVMGRLSQALIDTAEPMGYLWTLEAGAPAFFTQHLAQAGNFLTTYYAQLAQETRFVDVRPAMMGGYGLVVREPIGVVAAVVPWNAPVFSILIKLAPALMAGCTMVVKPSPETPLSAYILAECIEQAGFPKGVVNIVAADREASDHLIRHPGIDKVSFTGSTGTGAHIMKANADRFTRVTTELGGKSAAIVLDDADMAKVIPALSGQVIGNCGQLCIALTRVLVPRARQDEWAEALAAGLDQVRIGDPFDMETQIGTLAMKRQFERVSGYVETGLAEGARLVTGGGRPANIERGYFFQPTLFANGHNQMRIAREEIFGPVITMIPYDSVDEAVAIANDSDYGLHGAVFTDDVERAWSIARRLETGSVGMNSNTVDLGCPVGGWKHSGIGREGGPEGLFNFTELKTVYLPELPAGITA